MLEVTTDDVNIGCVSERVYRGATRSARRAERRARLIDAGLAAIGEHGWPATTVRDVCARAGLTERYFYESFQDREALLLAVFDEVAAGATAAILEALGRAPRKAGAQARAAIDAFVRFVTDVPHRARVLLLESATGGALYDRREEAVHAFATLLGEEAIRFYGASGEAAVDARLTAHALAGALAELLVAWQRGVLAISRARLVDHAVALFVAASRVSSAPTRR